MEEVEGRALITFTGNGPMHWFRYVDDTWVRIRAGEVEAFTEHINAVDNNIEFTWEAIRGDLPPISTGYGPLHCGSDLVLLHHPAIPTGCGLSPRYGRQLVPRGQGTPVIIT